MRLFGRGERARSASTPLSGLRLVTTLPPKRIFGGWDLSRAREHSDGLRHLGATVYELDTTAFFDGNLPAIKQQQSNIIEFRPDAAIATPHAGYLLEGARLARGAFPEKCARNLFLDEPRLPVILFWDHTLVHAPRFLLEQHPKNPDESRSGALKILRDLFARPNVIHFFPDSAHAAELGRVGVTSFDDDRFYVQAIGSPFLEFALQAAQSNSFDEEVAFFGNIYLDSAKGIPYARDQALGRLRERARAAHAADWSLSPYRAYVQAIDALGSGERAALRLLPDESFFWRFLYDELVFFMNGDERLRKLRSCAREVAFFGNFADADSTAMMAGNHRMRGSLPYGRILAEAVRRTRVVVDIANAPFINGFSVKLVDFFAAGGFVLTDRKKDIGRAFGPLADEICCHSPDEFAGKLEFFLTHEPRRFEVSREIGAIARAKYSAEALFARTVPQALEQLKARGVWKIIRRRLRRFEQPQPSVQTLAAADVSQLSAQPHWIGARVIPGTWMVVETIDAPWGYSATLPLARLRQNHRGDDDRLFWQVEVEVYAGNVGLSLIDGESLLAERVLTAGDGRRTIYLPAEATATDLMVRNGPSKGQSRIAIYNVRLIVRV